MCQAYLGDKSSPWSSVKNTQWKACLKTGKNKKFFKKKAGQHLKRFLHVNCLRCWSVWQKTWLSDGTWDASQKKPKNKTTQPATLLTDKQNLIRIQSVSSGRMQMWWHNINRKRNRNNQGIVCLRQETDLHLLIQAIKKTSLQIVISLRKIHTYS